MVRDYRAVPTTPRRPRGRRDQDLAIDVQPSPQNHRGALMRGAPQASPEPLRPQVPPSAMASTPTLNRQRSRNAPTLSIPDQSFASGNSASPTSHGTLTPDAEARKRPRPYSVRQSAMPRKGTIVLHPMQAEPDDYLHIPDKNPNAHARYPTWRGCINVLTLAIIVAAIIMLFLGYPLVAHFDHIYGKVDVNSELQSNAKIDPIPVRPLIDPDTPQESRTRTGNQDGSKYNLVFSDEFNTPGRTFWPGDDPYWEAVDIWYGATFDFEWYTPEGVNTTTDQNGNGVLQITLEEEIERGQYFRSGMLQSWNKFCFQGGFIEAAIQFPGGFQTQGYWPGFWLMGNLGRPGYLASADGMWPYVYDDCDVGIMPNQTYADGRGPYAALHGNKGKQLSKLPGMRYPSCTCKGEDHPGPNNGVARSAPEIDICELQVETMGDVHGSYASQSYQVAPFDDGYNWQANSSGFHIYDDDISEANEWMGGPTQEAMSTVTRIDDTAFENLGQDATYTILGVEYEPDWDGDQSGYITFYANNKPTVTINSGALSRDSKTMIGQRTFSQEPMSIIFNLGIASGFQYVSTCLLSSHLHRLERWQDARRQLPCHHEGGLCRTLMKLTQRVYQRDGVPDSRKSCDPPDHPTADYINRHLDLYMNNNLTRFEQGKTNGKSNQWPKNKLKDGC